MMVKVLSLALLVAVASATICPGPNPTAPDTKDCSGTDVCTAHGCCGKDVACSCVTGNPNYVAGGQATTYGCGFTAGGTCPDGTPVTCGPAPASSKGDPLVRGFDGCSWYLSGKPDTVINLISEANHVVNTLLVPANLTDEHHGGEGTFHGAISVRYQDTVVLSRITPQGNLTVEVGGALIPFDTIREAGGLTVKVTEHYPYYGQVAEIVTPAFRIFIHAVQPYDTPAGWSRGHLDFSASATAETVMHGLLGQSVTSSGALCSEDFNFHGEGKEEDYMVPDLKSVDYVYSRFATLQTARRLQSVSTMYKPATVIFTAASDGLVGVV